MFARYHCHNIPVVLPDVDPYDKWDKELEEGEMILVIDFKEAIRIRVMHHIANDLAAKANADKKTKTFEEMILDWCRDFKDLFNKDNFDELPEPKPWDHAIELTLNSNANLDCKVCPLNCTKQEELNKFLDENLFSERICPSKSPMASPFFLSRKRMANCNQSKITESSMRWWSKTGILYPSSLSLWTNYGVPSISPNWTYTGDIIMSVSNKMTNGRWLSEEIEGCSNPWSCFLDSWILPLPFNGWWMASSKT